jgi:hypothetical protein
MLEHILANPTQVGGAEEIHGPGSADGSVQTNEDLLGQSQLLADAVGAALALHAYYRPSEKRGNLARSL